MIRVPSMLVLNLTNDCNMRCKYCYASAGTSTDKMNFDTAIRIITQMHKLNKNKVLRILFHGGEPLLCFDTIKQIVEYCESNFNKNEYKLYIQTNCVLLNEETITYLHSHDIEIGISIDGNDKRSNSCRILCNGDNSINTLKEAISIMNNKDVNFSTISVLNKHNYKNIAKILKFYARYKIYSFSLNYFIKSGRGIKNRNLALTNKQLFEVSKKIISLIEKYKKKGIILIEKNIYHLIKTILTNQKRYMCAGSPCGAGLYILGITPQGDIFPCDDLSSEKSFCLGNINVNSLEECLDNKVINHLCDCCYENISECKDCELKQWCGAGCCSRKFFENGDIYSVDPICGFYKLIIPYIKKLLKSNKISRELYE